MHYSQLKPLKPGEFRRYSGIKPETFERLANDLRPHLPKAGQRSGQPGFTPVKKPRGGKLSETQKVYNRELGKLRVKIEHVTDLEAASAKLTTH